MKKALVFFILVPIGMMISGLAYAQFARSEDAVAYRKSVMVVIAHHFGRIASVVKGDKAYEPKEVAQHADLVAVLSKLPWDAFMVPGTAGKTGMSKEALEQPDVFKTFAELLEKEAGLLSQAAAESNLQDIKVRFGSVGGSCKACHDKFRRR
jgi:cytochrome c556